MPDVTHKRGGHLFKTIYRKLRSEEKDTLLWHYGNSCWFKLLLEHFVYNWERVSEPHTSALFNVEFCLYSMYVCTSQPAQSAQLVICFVHHVGGKMWQLSVVAVIITYAVLWLTIIFMYNCTVVHINILWCQKTSLQLAAQALESGSLAGAVVGACIGTALLYTMVLLVVKFALVLWNKRHRSVWFHLAVYLYYYWYRYILIRTLLFNESFSQELHVRSIAVHHHPYTQVRRPQRYKQILRDKTTTSDY